ncbi:MAG: peptidase M15 [Bacteroidales bacterium]|nr:peptidase M15 [Bacteroidales bacterium]
MYGESRVIVGAHWQSDVDAARLGSAIFVSRLHTSPEFLEQLAKAQKEFKRLTGKLSPIDDDSQFVNLAEAIPDAILEIRYYSTYNFVGARVDGYLEPVALLTRQAADSLRAVSEELKRQGYRLKIYDAYRPQCAVDHFMRWCADVSDTLMKPYFYPEVPRDRLFELGYIAEKSGHTRGSTVDLTLFDMRTEKEVDMGGTFDWFGIESHPDFGGDPDKGSYKANGSITEEQFKNRMILREAMLRHGFQPVDTEWWHFTLTNEPFPDTYFNFPVKRLPN